MLTSLSLPSQHQGHHCICIAVSLSISLSFSFTLWMVHLAYKTEWIHNPGQFKIPWGPVGIEMKPHKQKRLLQSCLQQPFIQLFLLNVADKRSLPLTQELHEVYQWKTESEDLQEHDEHLPHCWRQTSPVQRSHPSALIRYGFMYMTHDVVSRRAVKLKNMD